MKIEVASAGPAGLTFQCTVPCKVNLFLDVLGKRADGYHELDTIMLAVSLCDVMTLLPVDRPEWHITLSFDDGKELQDGDPAWLVPADEKNLAVRALKLLAQKLGRNDVGGKLHIHKSIPAMAGLGGGSANAAAALALGFAAWGNLHQWPLVLECASKLGSDINFFLEGANPDGYWLARCRGRGEQIQPLSYLPEALALVVVHPPTGCGTAEVFSKLNASPRYSAQADKHLSKQTSELQSSEAPTSIDRLLESLTTDGVCEIGRHLYNALEVPAAEVTDWISRARSWIDRYDHFGQTLSGSGSARFCLCSSMQQAEIIEKELRSLNMVRAYAVRPWHQSRLQDQMQAIKGLSQ